MCYTHRNGIERVRGDMSYSYSTLDEGHIIILTLHSDFDIAQELGRANVEGNTLAEQLPEPLILINDARALFFSSLNELLASIEVVRQIKPENRLNRNPKVLKSLSVIQSPVMQLAAKGFNTA